MKLAIDITPEDLKDIIAKAVGESIKFNHTIKSITFRNVTDFRNGDFKVAAGVILETMEEK